MQAVLLGKEVDSAVETGKEPGKVIEMKTGVSDGSIGMVPRGVFGAEVWSGGRSCEGWSVW